MEKIILRMQEILLALKDSTSLTKVYRYFKNKDYSYILLNQFEGLINNLKSIKALLDIENAEDAFTIFRKYIETYLGILSVIENKEIAEAYVYHNKLLGQKVCGLNKDEIDQLRMNNPEGFIQYGYLKTIVNTNENGFIYSMRVLAKAAHREDLYYSAYRPSNNFVHNNLTSVIVDKKLPKKLLLLCEETSKYIISKIEMIIH